MPASVDVKHFNGLGAHLGNQWTFVSTGLVGTGAPVLINHGGGRKPLVVDVIMDDTSGGKTYTQGVHDINNLSISVSAGAFYSLIAYFGPGA